MFIYAFIRILEPLHILSWLSYPSGQLAKCGVDHTWPRTSASLNYKTDKMMFPLSLSKVKVTLKVDFKCP